MAVTQWYDVNMTSNTTPSPYVASASTQYTSTSLLAWKAFNGTNVGEMDRWRSANTSGNAEWIQLDFGAVTPINQFEITATIYATTLDGTPTRFVLAGSLNGTNFTDIGTYNTNAFTVGQGKVFEIGETVEYRYYRVNLSNKQGNVNYFNLGGVRFGRNSATKSVIYHDGEYKTYIKREAEVLTPEMTSNTTPSGIVSASGNRSGDAPWEAFDKDYGSLWVVNSASDQWIQYEFPEKVVIKEYFIYANNTVTQAPKNFILQGSNDGIDFTPIDTRNNVTYSSTNREARFQINNATGYKIIRLYINSNGGSSLISIAELGLLGYVDDGIDAEGWYTISDQMPTQEEIEKYGMPFLTPLLDKVNGSSPLDELDGNFELAIWSLEPNATETLEVQGEKSITSAIAYPISDISLFGVDSIDSVQVTATGSGKIAVSTDSGTIWKAYRGGQWIDVVDASDGMTYAEFNALNAIQLAELKGDSNTIRFSYYLTPDDEIDNIQMKVSVVGEERLADTADYTVEYDASRKTIIYNVKKSGTYTFTYVE